MRSCFLEGVSDREAVPKKCARKAKDPSPASSGLTHTKEHLGEAKSNMAALKYGAPVGVQSRVFHQNHVTDT